MQLHSAPRGGSGEGRLGAWRGRGRKFCVDGPQPVWAAGRGARRCCGRMGRRRRGGRRATPQRRAGDLFDVAFVVEELVRDVEALWEARAGVNHDDDDRCDRHAFCAAACVDDWDRYDNHCRGSCGYCDPVGAAGCKACARRRRRNLIRLRMDFGRHRADVLAVIADYRVGADEFGHPFRLPSLCALAPLPVYHFACACMCCRSPAPWRGGCYGQCCRRHGERAWLVQRCRQFATEIAAVDADPDGEDWRFAKRARVGQPGPVGMGVDAPGIGGGALEPEWEDDYGGVVDEEGPGWLVGAPPRADWRGA